MIFVEEVKDYVKRNCILQRNLVRVHAIIWGRFHEAMQARVKAHKGYDAKSDANDCLLLLTTICSVMLKFERIMFSYMSLLSA
jgi:hypothetical protein